MNLYLKYFYNEKKTLSESLKDLELENKKKELGIVTEDHINNIRMFLLYINRKYIYIFLDIDEKEEGFYFLFNIKNKK